MTLTGVHALVTHARQVGGTTFVSETNLHGWIAFFQAETNRLMVHHNASLVSWTQLTALTRILTFVVSAGQFGATVFVSVTLNVVSCTNKFSS